MILAAACGAWLLLGLRHAIGGAKPREVFGKQLDTPVATRAQKIKSRMAFYAKATGLMTVRTVIGPPIMAQRWFDNRWSYRERSSPIPPIPIGEDTIDSLGGFLTHSTISLERSIGEGPPIGTHEMKATGGSLGETVPRDPALNTDSIGSFHDEGNPVQIQ
jgi:hypothetical protein